MAAPPSRRRSNSSRRAGLARQNAGDEFRNRSKRRAGRVALRRMLGAGQQRHFDRAIAFLAGDLDLLDRAVLIVLPLYDQDRHADIGEEFGDIPFAEFGIEPGAVPTLEGVVDLRVPARKLRAKVAGLVGLARLDDGGNAGILGEEMRRDQREAADAVILMAAGVDRRDGSAVAVAYQQPALEADLIEQARQHVARLVVHVSQWARQRHRARFAIAGARIDEYPGAGRGG